jgi:hypothetical protein
MPAVRGHCSEVQEIGGPRVGFLGTLTGPLMVRGAESAAMKGRRKISVEDQIDQWPK